MVTAFSLPTFPSLLTAPNAPYIHRDLSWLQFNERVLAEAQLSKNPLLERVKFLAISSTNLDEFFMIRYPSLARSIQVATRADKQAALRLIRIRNNILEAVQQFIQKQSLILKTLKQELEVNGIILGKSFDPQSEATLIEKQIFDEEILPKLSSPELLTPTKLGSLENFQIAVIFDNNRGTNNLWLKIPRTLPLIFFRKGSTASLTYAYFLDEILLNWLNSAFQTSSSLSVVRLTRDGDFTADLEEEDTESIPDIVRVSLGFREKGKPVRMQCSRKLNRDLFNQSLKSLRLISPQIIDTPLSLCLHGISSIKNQVSEQTGSPHRLFYAPPLATLPRPFEHSSQIFDRLDQEDLLLHHPYDSFDAYVAWIRAACEDPCVIQIEQTVYRMDTISPLIEALKAAAKSKKVRVIIELRARFDELNNLRLADELRSAGVEVGFGFGKLKLHGKVALITRVKNGVQKLYAHLSTGNYNATTARQYTDLAILTSHHEMCSDVRYFFDRVWDEQIPNDFKCLVSAPTRLHRRLLSHIQAETEAAEQGKSARIVAKVNALVDDTVVQHLYRASQAGVRVDLIVRGACSLVPGVKGLSENIRVISIVDRFLEHSRIYYFGHERIIYLSSADWMPRNFFSRLELAFPVLDGHLYRYIEQIIIPAYLSDTVKAKELTPEGKWKRRKSISTPIDPAISLLLPPGEKSVRAQFFFEQLALKNYEGTPLWRKFYGNA